MTQRVFNFSAGPAVLPEPVLQQVQQDLMAFPGAGVSILEISHRNKIFVDILEQAQADLRQLLAIPDNYEVLFLQGGSRLQFSMVPMNLMTDGAQSADYILTGSWGKHSVKEATKAGDIRIAWDGKETSYDRLPTGADLDVDQKAAYAYFVSNETIEGVQFSAEPEVGDVPLVCDASSDILHRPLPIEKYGLLYACAQKNAGPAGVTMVIIRKDLLDRCDDRLPGYMNYKTHAKANSLWNTAPTFGIYVMGLVAKWLLNEVGGLDKMLERNQSKAKLLYDVLDGSNGFYTGHAVPECRSLMNVTFRLPSDELTEKFVDQAKQRDLHSLKGHRSVGGIRASIYNAMPVAGVEVLRDFMTEFHEQSV